MTTGPRRLVVGVTGASGVIYGIRLLEAIIGVEGWQTHLVMTAAAKLNVSLETDYVLSDVEQLADVVHRETDIAASIASGSFATQGMVVAPCSMKTLSAIAHSHADNLLVRAADVTLKQHRRLVLMPREAPLHVGHCRLLLAAAEMGAVVFPPVPSFYDRPASLDDAVNASVGRVLDLFGIETDLVKRWQGPPRQPR